ncbi:MAG: hypothetical protein PWP51_2035 [Clostridiales bacterium]|jgi:CheY-like chemotaxis protein|nr:hypothetical protein [Clostridiales bacterium]MDN5299482.1 hypothetical protein [Clostridiales bacterium]
MKFLVVDINTTTSYRIKKLVNENIDILVATSSFEAINRLTNHIDIDLVIIDVKLGAEDGYELIDRIKMLYPDIMVLVLTGLNTRKSFVQALKVGASDYVLKPFDDDYLRQKLGGHIEHFAKSKDIPDYSPNQIDQAVFHAVKKAVQENYELLIGLMVIYHKNPKSNRSTNFKDLAILRTLTMEVTNLLKDDDGIFHLGNNGIVIILPKRSLNDKEQTKNLFLNVLNNFIKTNEIDDTFVAGAFISLPNEINPKKNALTVLAKEVEKLI